VCCIFSFCLQGLSGSKSLSRGANPRSLIIRNRMWLHAWPFVPDAKLYRLPYMFACIAFSRSLPFWYSRLPHILAGLFRIAALGVAHTSNMPNCRSKKSHGARACRKNTSSLEILLHMCFLLHNCMLIHIYFVYILELSIMFSFGAFRQLMNSLINRGTIDSASKEP